MADHSHSAQAHADTIADLHHADEQRAGRHQQFIERLTRRLGRPLTLYFCVAALAGWIAFNVAPPLGLRPLDPAPFHGMQAVVTLAGLLLTIIVLITQNRQLQLSDRRAQLDLHVSLLSEQKIAKLVALLEELRRDSPQIRDRVDPVAEQMSTATDARAAAQAIEESLDDGSTE